MTVSKMDDLEVICDIPEKELSEIPAAVLEMHSLKMLYLDRNQITFLPEIMFECLPNLTWLDLRDNRLESLPTSIGTHQCLENLLLQNNRITHLPNELCRLSTLKVLQLTDNPLTYPPSQIIDSGLDDIMIYLQQELYKEEIKLNPTAVRSSLSTSSSSCIIANTNNRTESGTIKLEVLPTVLEQNLAQRILTNRQQYLDDKCSRDKVHKVIKSPSKTSVHSYYKNMNIRDYLPSQDKMNAEQVKQAWLDKLKELITDQERILQQERAMGALQNWRKEQTSSFKSKSTNANAKPKVPLPYDTNPAYNAYMTRADPSIEVNRALLEQLPKSTKPNVDVIIKDIMMQLQTARENLLNETNPDERIKKSELELNLIMDMHKKVSQLQKSNFL